MVNGKKLKKIITKIFLNHKLSIHHARLCSDALVDAELKGLHSHGLSRLKMYCDRIDKKLINSSPKFKIKNISKSISHIDADNSIGFVAADIAIKELIRKTKKNGIGLVGIKNSGHYGLSGYYAQQAVKRNLIVLCFTNAPPAIAPFGSKKALFGTNPICFGVPTSNKIPFILDTSLSVASRGYIRVKANLNQKIPKGIALDRDGKPTTSAKKALEGVQLPIESFKGSGLAWMVDILSGVLTGSAHGGKVGDPFNNFKKPQNVGHLFIAFKQNIFVNNFGQRMKKNIKSVKKLPKIKGVKNILYPGENKFKKLKYNLNKNIKISNRIAKDIELLLSR